MAATAKQRTGLRRLAALIPAREHERPRAFDERQARSSLYGPPRTIDVAPLSAPSNRRDPQPAKPKGSRSEPLSDDEHNTG